MLSRILEFIGRTAAPCIALYGVISYTTTRNNDYILITIFMTVCGIVANWDLLRGYHKRAILDNSLPIIDPITGLTAEQYYAQQAEDHYREYPAHIEAMIDTYPIAQDNTNVQHLLNTDLGELHPRSTNKAKAWDKILAKIQPNQTN